jgi:CBS domain-containing protein
MPQIRDVPIHSIPVVEPEAFLDEVVRLAQDDPLHAVALVNEGQYLGLFTENVLQSELIPSGADLSLLAVGPYTRPARVVAHPSDEANTVREALRRLGLEIAPVVANRSFQGVVTLADLEHATG